MNFALHLPFAVFAALGAMPSGRKRDRYVDENVRKAILAHLETARGTGIMLPVHGGMNRRIRLVKAWNEFISDAGATGTSHLVSAATRMVLQWSIDAHLKTRRMQSPHRDAMIENVHRSMCRHLDEGSFVKLGYIAELAPVPAFDDLRCETTGQHCRMIVEAWAPRLERLDMEESGEWVPLKDIDASAPQTVEIDLPTGELIIADYFRIAGFEKAFDKKVDALIGDARYDVSHCIDSEHGRYATTRATLAATGILEIATSDVTVAVHVRDDAVAVIDDHDESDETPNVAGMTRVGGICCERWTVLLADASVVRDLLKDGNGRLERFLASGNGSDVMRLRVNPGRWSVTFGEALHEPRRAESIGVSTTARTWFSMERITEDCDDVRA